MIALTNSTEREQIRVANRKLAHIESKAREVVLVLTVEQALKAERVVREAGRLHRWISGRR